jgi:meso-butanediol dehydrogenase/(S,S)-butanediol dehydrogenase/diacetyl reductase
MRFAGKVVIVTGAGSGIGEGTARRFSQEGAYVALIGHHRRNIESVAKDLPRERTMTRVADVSKWRQVEAAVNAVVKNYGALHVMVNNAGIFEGSTVTKTKPEEWERVMATNAGGVFFGSRAALPHLMRTGGCIVNTSSVSGLRGDWNMSAYNASKGAVSNLTRAMALDYSSKGVRINAVAPSFTLTEMTKGAAKNKRVMQKFHERMPLGRAALPGLAGNGCCWSCRRVHDSALIPRRTAFCMDRDRPRPGCCRGAASSLRRR